MLSRADLEIFGGSQRRFCECLKELVNIYYGLLRFSIVRGASKIKLKKVKKKRTVRLRRVIIFLNISRHLLLI